MSAKNYHVHIRFPWIWCLTILWHSNSCISCSKCWNTYMKRQWICNSTTDYKTAGLGSTFTGCYEGGNIHCNISDINSLYLDFWLQKHGWYIPCINWELRYWTMLLYCCTLVMSLVIRIYWKPQRQNILWPRIYSVLPLLYAVVTI